MDFVPKVFEIGFNKCGTRSFCQFLNNHRMRAAHWEEGALAQSLLRAIHSGTKPFEEFRDFQVFSDIMLANERTWVEGRVFFRELDEWFPGSIFVAIKRDRESWITSRKNHANGKLLRNYCKFFEVDESVALNDWRVAWDSHWRQLDEYFRGGYTSSSFVVIDLDRPESSGLSEVIGVELDWGKFPRIR